MADHKYLHLAIAFEGNPKTKEVQVVLDQATDWIRYAPNCWLMWTENSPEIWSQRIRKVLTDKEQFFICEVTANREGWLYPETWGWINKKR